MRPFLAKSATSVPGIQNTSGAVPAAISVRSLSWYGVPSDVPASYFSVMFASLASTIWETELYTSISAWLSGRVRQRSATDFAVAFLVAAEASWPVATGIAVRAMIPVSATRTLRFFMCELSPWSGCPADAWAGGYGFRVGVGSGLEHHGC